VHLELDLARAQPTDREAAAIAEAAEQHARAAGDATGETVARIAASIRRIAFAVEPATDELDALARAALPLLEQAEDHAGLVHAWEALAAVGNFRGRYEDWAQAAEQAVYHSRLAGRHDADLFGLAVAVAYGPRPADEALRTLDAFLALIGACKSVGRDLAVERLIDTFVGEERGMIFKAGDDCVEELLGLLRPIGRRRQVRQLAELKLSAGFRRARLATGCHRCNHGAP
jgi:hypothetical protein